MFGCSIVGAVGRVICVVLELCMRLSSLALLWPNVNLKYVG